MKYHLFVIIPCWKLTFQFALYLGQYNVDPLGVVIVGAHCMTADATGFDNFSFDLVQDFGIGFLGL